MCIGISLFFALHFSIYDHWVPLHIFTRHLYVFFDEMPTQVFCPFLKLGYFHSDWVVRFLYIFIRYMIWKCFLLSVARASLEAQKFYTFIISFIPSWFVLFISLLRTLCLTQNHKDSLLCVLPEVLLLYLAVSFIFS